MHEIDDGISETKNLELFGAECWRAAEGLRLPTLAGHGIPKFAALAFRHGSAVVHVVWFHRLPNWVAVQFVGFVGSMDSLVAGRAMAAMLGWISMKILLSWPECAETGLIGRSPTTLVGVVGS